MKSKIYNSLVLGRQGAVDAEADRTALHKEAAASSFLPMPSAAEEVFIKWQLYSAQRGRLRPLMQSLKADSHVTPLISRRSWETETA